MDEANFESRESKQSRAFYGLTAWNAVHLIIGVAAAGVAVSTSHWLDTTYKEGMQGLLGINHAGLWSVCFAEIPENETAKNLTDHLSNIVDENLFGVSFLSLSFSFLFFSSGKGFHPPTHPTHTLLTLYLSCVCFLSSSPVWLDDAVQGLHHRARGADA